jgi:type II secretory pathway pseudopilin PulG
VKTRFPTENSSRPPSRDALTILEMLVSTAILSFIVLGLTAVFIQTQRAFKTGIKQSDVTDAGRTIMDMIGNDLRQMSDARNQSVTNLYWGWAASNQLPQGIDGVIVRTNQQDEIYILVHTNTVWTGIGYAVSNNGPCLGTLYRYVVSTNSPVIDYQLFSNFYSGISRQTFGSNWHAVADGVIHLKLRAFDQNGNEPYWESYYGDFSQKKDQNNAVEFSYPPYLSTNGLITIISNTLPNSVELELAVLEPEAFARAQALVGNSQAVSNYLFSSPNKVDVFRQRITIPVASR